MESSLRMPHVMDHFGWSKLKGGLSRVLEKIDKHDIFTLSASFAYTTALALAPFLVIMLSVVSLLRPESKNELITQLSGVLGAQAGQAVDMIARNADHESKFSGISGILSFIVILISASAMFSQMRLSLDRINERETPKEKSSFGSFLREKFFSVGLVLGFVFLLIVSLVVTAGISAVFAGREGVLWEIVSLVFNFVLFSALFAAMFRFIPSDQFPWRRCAISGACAALFFLVGKTLIGIYLGKSAVGSAYGAAGSLVVLLVWLYYSSITLFVSYEFTNNVLLADQKRK